MTPRLVRIAIGVAFVTAAACHGSHALPDGANAADGAGDGANADAPLVGPHPFGSHGGYTTVGVIFPSNHSQAALDAATAAFYDAWKAKYLVAGCAAGQYRIKTTPATAVFTVSEGHGYGMLIAAIMFGHDPDAHAIFDGLYRYYDGHRSQNDSGLMAWAQDAACANTMGADSATDGDLDIAYALLLADRQWGSAGAIDYAAAARRIVTSILASDVHPAGSILVGDWAGAADSHYTGTRPSDFMTSHFRRFAQIAPRASVVVKHTYALVDYLQTHASTTTGLLPDFVVNATGAAPAPAPANWLEGADDPNYAYNACRVPWRIATDYLMTGEPRARVAVRRIDSWIRTKTADNPAKIVDGYKLDGTATGTTAELAFVAPFAVGAMIEPATGTNQAWLNGLWDAMAARATNEYYGDSLKLLAMIVASGNWWLP
jgi:endoglucanase